MGPRAFAHQKSDFTGASSENRAVTFMTAFGNLFIFRGLTSSLPYMCVLIYVVYVCVRAPRTSLGSSCSCHILQLFIVGKWTLFFFFFLILENSRILLLFWLISVLFQNLWRIVFINFFPLISCIETYTSKCYPVDFFCFLFLFSC